MKKSFWKNKKILVTGSEGFIGSYFFNTLLARGAQVVGTVLKKGSQIKLDNQTSVNRSKGEKVAINILDEEQLTKLCRRKKINLIIHCAALDGNSEFKKNNNARIMDENVRMATNVLNTAKELEIKEIVILSSAEIYALNVKNPIREEDDYRKYMPDLSGGYVAAKISNEILSLLYVEKFGLKIMLPRPTNVYGPGDKFDAESGRVIPSMINKILSGQEIQIWGDGRQERNFIYVADLVNIILDLIERDQFSIFNIAAGKSISIKNLAELISRITNQSPRICFDKTKPVGAAKRVLSLKKLNTALDVKTLDLEVGLRKTVKLQQRQLSSLVVKKSKK